MEPIETNSSTNQTTTTSQRQDHTGAPPPQDPIETQEAEVQGADRVEITADAQNIDRDEEVQENNVQFTGDVEFGDDNEANTPAVTPENGNDNAEAVRQNQVRISAQDINDQISDEISDEGFAAEQIDVQQDDPVSRENINDSIVAQNTASLNPSQGSAVLQLAEDLIQDDSAQELAVDERNEEIIETGTGPGVAARAPDNPVLESPSQSIGNITLEGNSSDVDHGQEAEAQIVSIQTERGQNVDELI